MRTLIRETRNLKDKTVDLFGWVNTRRDHGKIIFVDLRDLSGLAQVVFVPSNKEVYQKAEQLRSEWVVRIKGKVNERPEKMVNPDIETGKIEIEPVELEILNESQTLPFPIDTDGKEIDEGLRMKYRYLDLRRERMRDNMIRRYKAIKFIRDYLDKEEFVEIETPIITKSTPEGARDFVVPSRLHAGQFYALPQSPQQYKQLLMVAGFEKYFQIARCFRDEDSRANRAFGEFTQLDLEMSFVEQNDILDLTEKMFTEMIKKVFPEKKISQTPWPRLNYHDVMKKYGEDDPDIRKDKKDPNELAFAWIVNFPLFAEQSQDDFFFGSGKSKFAPSHHMFTAPHPDDVGLLDKDPASARGLQHDLVLNGVEVGGGSIRIHDPEIQQKVFDLIGFSNEQKEQFRHMLEAFTYGTPPHGGIAPGIDRLFSGILGEQSLRELMAFPKTGDGRDLLMDAPSELDEKQLKELAIKIDKK
jgi:aspartyl-tRNA synthetase